MEGMISMSIMVKHVSFDDYQKTQTNYKDANFLQSAEMAKLQLSRNHIGEVEALVFERDGLRIGQAIVVYRRSFRIFRKALLFHGPLLDYNSIADLTDLLEALILYLKKKNIASLSIHPYLTDLIRNEELEIIEEEKADEVSKVFEKLGFEQYLDPEQALVVNQMFVKPIDTFTTSDEMLAAFSPSLKRDLKKFTALNVKVEELREDNLNQFYDILVRTAERKGFSVHPLTYFQDLKRNFGESAKFMLAYLDCPAYLAYLFMDYGPEVVSFYGGNDEAYLNFGGAVLLHWEMLQYAKRKGKERFNFYGTIETEAASTGKGNFHFKRQFGGQLETLVGSFDKTLNPFYDIFKKTLGKD